MRHRLKKIKFRRGRDANRMLIRKLVRNFITKSKIKTTLKKASVLKSAVERLVEKAREETEANKNYLLRVFNDEDLVTRMFKEVGPALKDKVGGYVRIIKIGTRRSDGSEMARLEWVYPVVIEQSKSEVKSIKKATEPFGHSGKRAK